MKASLVKPIKYCRSCASTNMVEILSLGKQGLSDFVEMSNQEKIAEYPLELILCEDCSLLQMRHTTPPTQLYTPRYGYRSGINQTMKNELKAIVEQAERIISLNANDIVVDIGCNDGTLLASYKRKNLIRVGFDPVSTFVKYFEKSLNAVGVKQYFHVNDFFSSEPFAAQFKDKKAKIVTAISMFYDLDNPNKFIEDVKQILAPKGVFVIQQNYLVGMLSQSAFDNIVHEHLQYYSLKSLTNLLKRHNLEVFDVFKTDINGGSFRTFIRLKGSTVSSRGGLERIKKMQDEEKRLQLTSKKIYKEFADNVNSIRRSLKMLITSEVEKGKRIHVYGASTRGNTLLQACSLDSKLIEAAAERNTDKWGKKIASVGIPIVSEEQSRKMRPDYFLVLPWFFKEEFIVREKDFLSKGGKMIFPMPKPEVISMINGEIKASPLRG